MGGKIHRKGQGKHALSSMLRIIQKYRSKGISDATRRRECNGDCMLRIFYKVLHSLYESDSKGKAEESLVVLLMVYW